MLGFMHKAARVIDHIMSCFAIGLGLPEDSFKEVSDPMRFLMDTNKGTLRRIARTDFELLTLLFQRQGRAHI